MPIEETVFEGLDLTAEQIAAINAAADSAADKARVTASETAEKNLAKKHAREVEAAKVAAKEEAIAETKLSNDEKIEKERAALEAERLQIKVDREKIAAERMLVEKGYSPEQVEKLLPLLDSVKDASEISSVVENIIDVLGTTVNSKVDEVKAELLKGGRPPEGGAGDEGGSGAEVTREGIQKQIDAALAEGNTPLATSLTRQQAEMTTE